MTPGARVSAAIEVLDDYLLGKPVDKVLLNWFRANRFAGSKDRLAIRDLVFNCLRYKLSSHWPFQQAGFPIGGRVLLLGMLSDSHQCLEKFFDGKRYSPKTLSKLERVITKNFGESLSVAPTFVKLNFPKFLEKGLMESFGDNFWDNLNSLNVQANLFIRVNRIKANMDGVINSLKEDGIEVEKVEHFNNALKVLKNRRQFVKSKVFLLGKAEVQDINSQAVVEFIKPKEGIKILDFCAGAGGKTLALASFTGGQAEYYVHDKSLSKLGNLQLRCKRAGVKFKILDGTNPNDPNGKFDLVVADVPCSGTGVWRRNPGSKWSLTKDQLRLVLVEQKTILKAAGKYVKKNGTLAYITCSVLKSENQEQTSWFLSQDPTFSLLSARVLSPINGGDGFYVSLLLKNC